MQAIEHEAVGGRDLNDLIEIGMMRAMEPRARQSAPRRNPASLHPDQGTTQEPVSDKRGVQPQQVFAQAQRVHVGERKTRVGANGADVRDMIVEPFELEQDDAQIRPRAAEWSRRRAIQRLDKKPERAPRSNRRKFAPPV